MSNPKAKATLDVGRVFFEMTGDTTLCNILVDEAIERSPGREIDADTFVEIYYPHRKDV